jgi:hypothetical protein
MGIKNSTTSNKDPDQANCIKKPFHVRNPFSYELKPEFFINSL